MNDTPRFQWSKMSPDRSEQVVVRGDDYVQWTQDIKDASVILPKVAFPNDSGNIATPPEKAQEEAPKCGVHGTPMTLKPAGVSKAGRAYPAFWSCGMKNADGTYCRFKPS